MSAGIPQGTKIAIPGNDQRFVSDSSIFKWKFADDSTVSEIIPKFDSSYLQEQIDQIFLSTNEKRFQINPIKCKSLRTYFSRQQRTKSAITVVMV